MSTVAVDFDGVLADYRGWKGSDHLDEPLPGAIAFLWRLKRAKYQIVVFSVRAADRHDAIEQWLRQHGAPPVKEITNVKPPALVYIDDRAHRFDGDWDAAFDAIAAKPHWQQDWQEQPSGITVPPLRKLPT